VPDHTQTHRDHIKRARSNRTKFTVDERFFTVMGKKEALLLQKLIDLDDSPGTPRDGEFFLCTVEFLETAYWPAWEQDRFLKKLVARGFITVRRRKWRSGSQHTCRWVCIDYEGIDGTLDTHEHITTKQNARITIKQFAGVKYSPTENTEEERTEETVARTAASPPVRDDGPPPSFKSNRISMHPTMITPAPKGDGPPPSEEDFRCADGLHGCVTDKARVYRRWNRTHWAREFSRLRREVGTPRLERALNWYQSHITDQYTPVVWCARKFRERFADVEAAVSRWDRDNPPPVEVSEDARWVLKKLSRCPFPKGADAQLPAAVQHSLDTVQAVRRKAKVVRDKYAECYGDRRAALAKAARAVHMSLDRGFVLYWFEEVRARVDDWEQWSGKLDQYTLRGGGKHLDKLMREVLAGVGKEHAWDELVKEMGGCRERNQARRR
jgi:hypothetical protein